MNTFGINELCKPTTDTGNGCLLFFIDRWLTVGYNKRKRMRGTEKCCYILSDTGIRIMKRIA